MGWYLVVMFVGQTVFLAAFWSFFMAIWMGRKFLEILVPSGAGFGLTMGVFMTVMLAILLRPETVRLRVFDRADFLARLERAAAKLRYRPSEPRDGAIVYEPKALVRMAATCIFAEVGADEAVVTGPSQAVKRLKTEIEKG
jgi:hypothetical protein